MFKKLGLVLFCGLALLTFTGCGNKAKSEIVGSTFIYELTSSDPTYGDIITTETLIFEKDNKGTEKIDIEFTGAFKEYAESVVSYDTRHTSKEFTYTLDEKENTVKFTVEDVEYSLKYDKESKCLVDTTKEDLKWCK